ncbi:cache and HAMP domain-containing protein [Candidatus Synechococcus calcipolaris G9]|uniref:histidine kinase n=1 Tax=Candidatus Synechococcus calcipolaris G9 TaxID=1497997 RepID=A0ABT6F1V6_9SYNE|nr:cache and HAMP domain-containing protein [Candidatus Synechococcus calcipolaris]MDG2991808.1 cache and HAMP domain-containing protein [Candidatus Synechococcus calcipolaris G9]
MKDWRKRFPKPLWSISARLLIVMLLTSILPMAGVVIYNQRGSESVVKDSEISILKLVAIDKAGRIDQLLTNVDNTAKVLSQDYELQQFLSNSGDTNRADNKKSIEIVFNALKEVSDIYDAVILVDREGRAVLSNKPKLLGIDIQDTGVWQRLSSTQDNFISNLKIKSTLASEPVFLIVQPVFNNNEFIGGLILTLRATVVEDTIAALRPAVRGNAFLVDENGVILSHDDPSLELRSVRVLPSDVTKRYFFQVSPKPIEMIEEVGTTRLAHILVQAQQPGTFTYDYSGMSSAKIVGYAPSNLHPWVVVVSTDLSQFMLPLTELAIHGFLSIFFVGAGVAVISWVVSRTITRPIRALTRAVQALEEDRFEPEILLRYSKSHDDMGQLAGTFLRMAQEVQDRQDKLKQQLVDLKIEIDHDKREKQVAEITETDYFKHLRERAKILRQRPPTMEK